MVTECNKNGKVTRMAIAKYNAPASGEPMGYGSMDVEACQLTPGQWFHIPLARPDYRFREPIEIARITIPKIDTVFSVFDMRTLSQSPRGGRKPFGSSKHIYGDFLIVHEEDVQKVKSTGLKGVWHRTVEPERVTWFDYAEPDPELLPKQNYPGLPNDCRNGLGLPSSTSECLVLRRGEYGPEVQVSYNLPSERGDDPYGY